MWAKSVGTKISVTDNNGNDALNDSTYKYLYSLSSSTTQTLSSTYDLTNTVSQTSGDGEYYLIAQACDKAGNCKTTSSNKFLVDNTAPTCNWSGENTTWTTSAQTIKLTGTDNHKMNSSKTTYTKTYNTSGIELKTDSLSYVIADEAGNTKTCSKTVNVYYDTKSPSITTVNNPTNGNWVNYDFSVSLNVSESGSGIGDTYYSYTSNSGWTKNSATISGSTVTPTAFSAERNQLAYFKVCDKVGNCSAQASTMIRIDKTAPVITCNASNASVVQNSKSATRTSASGCSTYYQLLNITANVELEKNSIFSISGQSSYYTSTKYCDDSGNCENVSWKKTDGKCVSGYCYGTVTATAWDDAGNYAYKDFTYYVKY